MRAPLWGGVLLLATSCSPSPPSGFSILVEDAYVPGEQIRFSIEDECSIAFNWSECWARNYRAVSAEGTLVLVGDTPHAGQSVGTGVLVVTAQWAESVTSEENRAWVTDSVSVDVVSPDAVEISSPCTAGLSGDLVPMSSTLRVGWNLLLDGEPRDGWLATNPLAVDGLEPVQESLESRSADYRTPGAADATISITAPNFASTSPPGSVLQLRTYDASSADFDVDVTLGRPYLLEDPNDLVVSVDLSGGQACTVPAAHLASVTPTICRIEGSAHLVPLEAGTCEIELSLEGTSVRRIFAFDVLP